MAVVTGQEDVVKPMKRSVVLVSLILPVLMTGCASHTDVYALRADTSALVYQSSVRQQTVAARVQQLRDRVAQSEQSQVETRRGVAQAAATLRGTAGPTTTPAGGHPGGRSPGAAWPDRQ